MSKVDVLEQLKASINKKYGAGTILPASEAISLVVDRIPFGVFELDVKIGGGIPRGRVTVIKGDYSTGKSGLTYKCACEAQKMCRFCGRPFEIVDIFGEVHELDCRCGKRVPMRIVLVDIEHAFDPLWTTRWGVDTKNLLLIQTEYAEQAIDVAEQCIRSKECDLLIIDSVAAMTPSIEIEESSEKWQVGVAARLIGKAFRKWTSGLNSAGLLSETKSTILLVNQYRMALGKYTTITSPGGKAPDFYESLELRLKKNGPIIDEGSGRPIGVDVEFVVQKNKTHPMSAPGLFNLYFVAQKGHHRVGDTDTAVQVVRMAAYWGILRKAGSWVIFPDGSKLQGEDKAGAYLLATPRVMTDLMDRVRLREDLWKEEGLTASIPNEDSEGSSAEETDSEDVE
jgi:recombination protein RecA